MPAPAQAISEALLRLYAPVRMPEFSLNIFECLKILFPSDQFSVDEVFFGSGEVVHHGHFGEHLNNPEVWQAWALYSHQNPLVRDLADQLAAPIVCLSDVISFRQLSRLDLYQEGYRRIVVRDQIGICLQRPQSVLGITINSEKNCTSSQRAVAEFLYPHMVQAQQNAALASPQGFDALPSGQYHLELPLDPGISAVAFKQEARLVLDRFFTSRRTKPWQPPADLVAWIGQRRKFFEKGNSFWRRHQPLFLRSGPDVLHINLTRVPAGGEILSLICRFDQPLKKVGLKNLTPREAEIADWVMQGKTNGEIAVILGISPLTVKTHVERILAKQGVENRAALALTMRP